MYETIFFGNIKSVEMMIRFHSKTKMRKQSIRNNVPKQDKKKQILRG